MPDILTRREARDQPKASDAEDALQELLKEYEKRSQRLADEYLRKMGEHIADIGTMWPSDVHRLQQIRRMNRNLKQLQNRIRQAAGITEEDLEGVFQRVANEDARMAAKILGVPDTVNVGDNEHLKRILQAQARETAGRMRNLANTTAVSKYYRRAVDEAVTAVQSGVEDYGSAIRRAIREAGAMGLRVTPEGTARVDYESGRSMRLDSAVRMNILDGVRHLNQDIMEEVGREFGADGVEIDAHMLCAEDHLPYQGGQYTNEEFEEIQDGLQRPFGEWNCRHSWHPIIMGISPPTYTKDQLREMREYSTEEIEIDGRTKTRYQWSQEMRRCEVAIRQQKDTAKLAEAAGDKQLQRKCQEAIGVLNGHYGKISGKAGVDPDLGRTYVQGFRDAKLPDKSKNGVQERIVYSEHNTPLFYHGTTPEIQQAQTFMDIARYFWYEDSFGHLRPPIDDSMGSLDMETLKEIAEGIQWAKQRYNLTDEFPKSIMLAELDVDTVGEYNLITREISIAKGIDLSEAYLTAVHEMTHFVDDIKGNASADILNQALTELGITPGSRKALNEQKRITNDSTRARSPKEVLAYSVEKNVANENQTTLSKTIVKLWYERIGENQ